MGEPWEERARCAQKPAWWFFSDDARVAAKAKEVCVGCPVTDECAERGRDQRYGVWAGVDKGAGERNRKRRSHVRREVA